MAMEQEYQDLKNLNPMFYWQFVMSKHLDRLPCVLIKGEPAEGVLEWIQSVKRPVDWIIEDGENTGLRNVVYRERNRLTEREWLKGLTTIDFLLCNEKEKIYWMTASLCGVSSFFSLEEIEKQEIRVLNNVERIENWEFAKNLLT